MDQEKPKYKDDPRYQKYFKMKSEGVPDESIQSQMEENGLNVAVLETPEEISVDYDESLHGQFNGENDKKDDGLENDIKVDDAQLEISGIEIENQGESGEKVIETEMVIPNNSEIENDKKDDDGLENDIKVDDAQLEISGIEIENQGESGEQVIETEMVIPNNSQSQTTDEKNDEPKEEIQIILPGQSQEKSTSSAESMHFNLDISQPTVVTTVQDDTIEQKIEVPESPATDKREVNFAFEDVKNEIVIESKENQENVELPKVELPNLHKAQSIHLNFNLDPEEPLEIPTINNPKELSLEMLTTDDISVESPNEFDIEMPKFEVNNKNENKDVEEDELVSMLSKLQKEYNQMISDRYKPDLYEEKDDIDSTFGGFALETFINATQDESDMAFPFNTFSDDKADLAFQKLRDEYEKLLEAYEEEEIKEAKVEKEKEKDIIEVDKHDDVKSDEKSVDDKSVDKPVKSCEEPKVDTRKRLPSIISHKIDDIVILSKEMQECFNFIKQSENLEGKGWKINKTENEITISKYSGSKHTTTRWHTTINAPIANVLKQALNFDNWINAKYYKFTKPVEKITKHTDVRYTLIGLDSGYSSRRELVYMRSYISDSNPNGSHYIVVQSIKSKKVPKGFIKGAIRGKIYNAGLIVKPLDGLSCQVIFVTSFDLGGWIPIWMNNYFAGDEPFALELLRNQSMQDVQVINKIGD